MPHQKLLYLLISILIMVSISFSQKIDISGKVVNKDNTPQIGIVVTLKGINISDTTGSDGLYHLTGNGTALQPNPIGNPFFATRYDGTKLFFSVKNLKQDVTLEIYNFSGKKISSVLGCSLEQGNYSIAPFSNSTLNLPAQVYMIRLKVGKETSSHMAYNIWQGNQKPVTFSPIASLALAKQSTLSDTLIFIKDGQIITSTAISNYVDTLPELYIIQRDIFGNLTEKPRSFSEIRAVISSSVISDSPPKVASLWYNEANQSFSGFVYFVYTIQVQNYSVQVDALNKEGSLIGRSEKIHFPSTAGNINIPTFNPNNAAPVVDAGMDTAVSVKDAIRLHPVAVDSFGGSIKKWEWSINGGVFVQTATGDTTIMAPADSNPLYKCIIMVTDNNGNIALDSLKIVVYKDVPKASAGKDTTVLHIANDRVHLHGSASQLFGTIMKWEWDFGGKGIFVQAFRADTSILLPNIGNFPYLCILRVTDDDGNISAPDTMQVEFSPIIWKSGNKSSQLNAPAIGNDGTIYASGSESMARAFALDKSGSQKWDIMNTGGFPVIGTDGTIHFNNFKNFGNTSQVTALGTDGTMKWKFTESNPGWVYSSPSVIGKDGTIYFACQNGNVYAINSDGSKKWKSPINAYGVGNPAIGTDGTIYFASNNNNLYAVNPDSTLKWKFTSSASFIYSAPAIGSDGTIYVTNSDTSLYALSSNGTLKWNFPKLSKTFNYSTSAVTGVDGTIYVGGDSTLYAINPNGTLKWKFKAPGSLQKYSPAVGSDGTIYITSSNQQLFAVNPNGTEKWKAAISSSGLDLVIGNDGTIYGVGNGEVYAIASDVTGPAASSWPMIGHDAQHTGRMK